MSSDDENEIFGESSEYRPIKGKKASYEYWDLFERADEMVKKSMVVYGESGYGKSFLMNTYLAAVSPYITIMFAYSSTATSDKEFPMTGYTSPLFIKDTLDMNHIKEVMTRGTNMKNLYLEATELTNMKESTKHFVLPLYKKYNQKQYSKALYADKVIRKRDKAFDRKKHSVPEVRAHEEKMARYYSVIMYECKVFLRNTKLSIPPEYKKYCVPVFWHDLRPSTLILINDFGTEMECLKGEDKEILNALHTKERHAEITVVSLVQHATHVNSKVRPNVKINIFLTPDSIHQYIGLCKVKGKVKEQLEDAAECVIASDRAKPSAQKKYFVVLYDKMNSKIYYSRANTTLKQQRCGNEEIYKLFTEYELNSRVDNNKILESWQL